MQQPKDKVSLDVLELNSKNPKTISESRLAKLMDSLLSFPKMMTLRPIVYETKGTKYQVLGGNQRTLALKHLASMPVAEMLERLKELRGFKKRSDKQRKFIEVFWVEWKKKPYAFVSSADELTEAEKKEFIIKDNVEFGDWDLAELADWDAKNLEDWGLQDFKKWDNLPPIEGEQKNPADKGLKITIEFNNSYKDELDVIKEDIDIFLKDKGLAYVLK